MVERLALQLGEDRQHVWVHGPRDTGKCEFVAATAKRLADMGFRALRVNLAEALGAEVPAGADTNAGVETWSRSLLDRLRKIHEPTVAAPAGRNTPNTDDERLWTAVNEVIGSVATVESRAVLFVEEVDIAAFLGRGDLIPILLQRLAATDSRERALTICVTSILPSEILQMLCTSPGNEDRTVDRKGAFASMAIGDLDRDEMRVAFRPLLSKLDKNADEAIDTVHEWTGGHVFLAHRACKAVQDAFASRDAKILQAETVAAMASRVIRAHLVGGATAEMPEVSGAIEVLRRTTTTPFRGYAGLSLDTAADRLRSGLPPEEPHPAGAVLALAGLASYRDGLLVPRDNRIMEALFSPERIHREMSDAGMSADERVAWLKRFGGPILGSGIETIRRSENEQREKADAVNKTLTEVQTKRSRLSRALVAFALAAIGILGARWWSARQDAVKLGDDYAHLRLVTDENRQAAESRERELQTELDQRDNALKAATENAATSDAVVKKAEEDATNLEQQLRDSADLGTVQTQELRRKARNAQDTVDAAKRDLDAAKAKRAAAEAAQKASEDARDHAQATVNALTGRLAAMAGARQEALDQLAAANAALIAETALHNKSDSDLDKLRKDHVSVQVTLDACVADKKSVEADLTSCRKPPLAGAQASK